MLSRSLGNRGWERTCSVKYSCIESWEDKARAAVKAITYVLLPDLLPSANLSPFPYTANWTHTQTHTQTQTQQDHYIAVNMGNVYCSFCVQILFKLWKVNHKTIVFQLMTEMYWLNFVLAITGLCGFSHITSQSSGECWLLFLVPYDMPTTGGLFLSYTTMP